MPKIKIQEYPVYSGQAAMVYPFQDNDFTNITARANPGGKSFDRPEYKINWPSIGAVDTEKARQFALGILSACAWVDAREEAHIQAASAAATVDIQPES